MTKGPGLRILVAVVLAAGLLAACAGGAEELPQISDARIGQPTGPNAALYLNAGGYGAPDRLIGASTSVAQEAALHETVIGSEGTASMQPVAEIGLSADGELVLEPGGIHIMLIDVDRLEIGATIEVELMWETAGPQQIEAVVVAPSDTMDHGMSEEGTG